MTNAKLSPSRDLAQRLQRACFEAWSNVRGLAQEVEHLASALGSLQDNPGAKDYEAALDTAKSRLSVVVGEVIHVALRIGHAEALAKFARRGSRR